MPMSIFNFMTSIHHLIHDLKSLMTGPKNHLNQYLDGWPTRASNAFVIICPNAITELMIVC